VIMSMPTCNSCHHREDRLAESTCESCHEEVASIFRGTFEGRDMPDIMADAEVECADCHLSSGEVHRPELTVCADCHDEDYPEMGAEWAAEVTGLIDEVGSLLDGLTAAQRATPEVERIERIRQALIRSGAGGIHNYEMSSGLLLEARRTLQGLSE